MFQPILKEDIRARGSTKQIAKINVDSPLYCPHDLTKNFGDNLPTLLTQSTPAQHIVDLSVEQNEPACSIFKMVENKTQEKLRQFRSKTSFLGPFERYQLVRPFIEARERKLAEEKAKKEEEERTKQEDNRTDEERIESVSNVTGCNFNHCCSYNLQVRQHFLHLARQTLPEEVTESGRKRKRCESTGNTVEEHLPKIPLPNLRLEQLNETPEVRRRNRKRKSTQPEVETGKVAKTSRRERNKLRMQKRKQKRAILNNSDVSPNAQTKNQGTFSQGR